MQVKADQNIGVSGIDLSTGFLISGEDENIVYIPAKCVVDSKFLPKLG